MVVLNVKIRLTFIKNYKIINKKYDKIINNNTVLWIDFNSRIIRYGLRIVVDVKTLKKTVRGHVMGNQFT